MNAEDWFDYENANIPRRDFAPKMEEKTMNYEEKYNEALERAKILKDQFANWCITEGGNYLDIIFPELRESEGERIRQWLIRAVHMIGVDKDICADQESMDKAIAWLEKQKEQKPNIEICPHSIKSKSFGLDPAISKDETSENIVMRKDLFDAMKEQIYDEAFDDGVKSVEQKLAEWDAVSNTLAMALMDYLDSHRPDGKMCLSNMECEDIDKAFADMDFAKIRKYIDKYIVSGLLEKLQ